MEIRDYEELKKKLCKELDELKNSKSLGMDEIEAIDKLTHSIKSINAITESEGSSYGRYSQDGNSYENSYGRKWSAQGSYGDSYDGGYNGGTSERNRHYVRGHYSYGEDETGMMEERIEEMLHGNRLSVDEKSTLKRAMDILRK